VKENTMAHHLSLNAFGALVDAAAEALSLMRWEGWENENARPDQRECVAALAKALEEAS
jgi:hypothetical protein